MRFVAGLSTFALLGLVLVGCDSSNPVAPAPGVPAQPTTGAGLTVTVSPSPTQLEVSSTISSTVTVTVQSADGGAAPANGTQVVLNTDLGSFGSDSQGNATTLVNLVLQDGQAVTRFFAGDQLGTANLLAQVGESVGQAQITVLEAVPEVFFLLEIQPNLGNPDGGETVAIKGDGFKAPLRVSFGGALATVLEVPNKQTILVETPASITEVGPGASLLVDVTVTNSLDLPTPPTATLPGSFTYTLDAPPPFFLLEAQPNVGSPDGGDTVVIRGGGFRSPLRVEIGGKVASDLNMISAETLSVVAPASAASVPAGTTLPVDIVVFNAINEAPSASATLAGGFTYDPGPVDGGVVVTSAVPGTGPNEGGTTVDINGQGFEEPISVKFGNVEATSISSVTSTRITAVTPPATGFGQNNQNSAVDVVVTNLDTGQAGTLAAGFTYGTAVVVTSMDPSSGTYEGGTTVTVLGQGFVAPATVRLGGAQQDSVTVSNSGSLTFVTAGVAVDSCPASGILPQVGLTVTNVTTGNSGSNLDLIFDYLVPLPRITQVSPQSGPQTGGVSVFLEGANFESPSQVVFFKDTLEFSAVVQSENTTQVRVVQPSVPDTLFDEVDCTPTDDASVPGKRFTATTVGVRLTNFATGCQTVFGNGFTYTPTDTSCRPTTAAAP